MSARSYLRPSDAGRTDESPTAYPAPVVVPEDDQTSVADVKLGPDLLSAIKDFPRPKPIAALLRRRS